MISRSMLCVGAVLTLVATSAANAGAAPTVHTLRLPDGGFQPQVVVGKDGTVHVIYLAGDPSGADIQYARAGRDGTTLSKPIRVNSQSGSAVGLGTIRGPHIALGTDDRVHVAWMGSSEAEPRAVGTQTPMLYARMNDKGDGFTPQRNVIQKRAGLDGGGAIAADRKGNVYIVWHAPEGDTHDEASRRVWVARSTDDGATFAAETAAFSEKTGVCACCGMNAFADASGAVNVLYRSATDKVNRDMYLLRSVGPGSAFEGVKFDAWESQMCVMSTASFGAGGALVAWETQGRVHYGSLGAGALSAPTPLGSKGSKPKRKYPAVAANSAGQVLLVWTEGNNWRKNGKIAWKIYDAAGKPIPKTSGRTRGLPAWGLTAAFANADGSFTIVY